MAFDYSKNVKGKDEKAQALKIQQQAVAKSKTTTPTQKKEAPKPDLIKPLVSAPAKVEAAAKKFLSAATFGLTDVLTNAYQPQKTAQLEQTAKEQPVVSTIATGLGYLSPGTAGTKLVKPLVSKAVTNTGSKLAGNVLEGALVGTGITAAENIAPVATGQKSVGQAAKEVGTGLVLGAGLDVGLYGLGKVAKPLLDKIKLGKALTQAEKVEVAKSANVEVSKVDDLIKKSVEPKASKLQQIAKELEQPQVSAKKPTVQEKSPSQHVQDFQNWRKDNFGGAFGNMAHKDNVALKELYKESTGIDLDYEISNSLRNMQNKAVGVIPKNPLPEITQPIITPRQEALSKALKQIETDKTPITKPVDVTAPTVAKTDKELAIEKLDKEYTAEVKRLKDQMQKGMLNKELGQSKIKAQGFKHAAEKRALIQGDSLVEVKGGFTPKELADKIKKEKSNYVGKSVITPNGEGKIFGNSFGKIGVEFEDGTRTYFEKDAIKSKVDVDELIKTQKQQANVPKSEENKIQQPPTVNKPTVEATQPSTELVKPLVDTNIDKVLTTPKIDLNEPKPQVENRFNPQVETPEGMKLSKFNETAANSPVTGDELVKKINSNPVVYKPTTRAGQVEAAKKVVDEDFEAAVQMVRSGDKFKSEIENAVGLEVFKKLQEQGRYDDAFEVISALSKKGSAAGKDIESFKIWSTSTPEGLQRWAAKTLEATTTKPDPKIIAEVGDRMKLVQSSNPEQLANEVVGRIKNKTEQKAFLAATKGKDAEQLRAIATAQIMSDVFKKINPQELTQKTMAQGRKLSSFQSISQLLSLVTFQRNLYGNLINLGAEQLAKYPAAAADSVASLFTKQRSISGSAPKWKQSINQGLEQSKTSIAEILAGVQRNTGDKNEVIVQPAFANIPILREMEKALSLSLTTPDELFKGFVASDSMYNQLRARIGKEADNMSLDEIKKALTAEEFETAIEEAKFATFQNDSLPSVLLTKLKNVLNIVGYGGEKYKTKEFGLGDLVIKYTKVPGNIIARGVEFSPVGYAKAISKLAQIKDVKSQREFAQAFGRATTGTGLMSLGAMLYDQGLIVGEEAGLSAREKGLSTAEGKRGFKLNISALSRLASGGDAKIQPTDTLISFDALQPVTIPITVGANIQEEAKKGGLSKNKVASKVSEKTFNEVLDLPALYTINQIYNESRKEGSTAFDVMTVPVKEAVSGFVPALVRQTAQTIDPVVRETKGADSTETAKNKVLAQIPFASKKLEPKITPTGKESKRDLGGLSAFLDPFKTTEYKPTGYTDKLKAIKELSGETKQFLPTVAPSTITIGKEKITLTAAEKTKYMKIVGSYLDEQYTKVLQNVNTSDLNPAKAKNLSDRLSKLQEQAREKAKLEIKKGR